MLASRDLGPKSEAKDSLATVEQFSDDIIELLFDNSARDVPRAKYKM